jgi:hypothetical protein
MPRRLGEAANIDLSDVEEGDAIRKCRVCGRKLTKLVRIISEGLRSKTFFGACTNKDCWKYINIAEVANWERVDRSGPAVSDPRENTGKRGGKIIVSIDDEAVATSTPDT